MWESLRKFGLEYCDLSTMLSNVSAMMRILTLNIDGRDKRPINIVIYTLIAITFLLYIYVYVFSGIWFTFCRCQETGDLVAAMIVFSLNTTSEAVVVKMLYMRFYEEKLKKLTNRYLECDSRIVQGSRFFKNMRTVLRTVKMRGIIYFMVLAVDTLLYIVQPIIKSGQHLTADAYVIYGLEPMFQSPNYEIAIIIMAIDIFFICYSVAIISLFLILIIGYIEAQILSLSEEMRHVWTDAKEYYEETIKKSTGLKTLRNKVRPNETEIVNNFVKKNLIDIIGRHALNVNLLQEIELVMRGPNAIGFLFLIIGLIAELLGGLENTILQLPFTLIQLGVDCYLGQKIIDANIQFEQAVYECKWENFNQSNKKIVLVMLQNSQKTMMLSAGGMATLSFSCFMYIIKATYSAYTTLRSTM